MMKEPNAFTLVFEGDIRSFKMNPLTTATPWGIPYAVSIGDALEENDALRGGDAEVFKQMYEDATASLWATETKLHAANVEIERLRGIAQRVTEIVPYFKNERIQNLVIDARAALDAGLPTAEDVRGILKS